MDLNKFIQEQEDKIYNKASVSSYLENQDISENKKILGQIQMLEALKAFMNTNENIKDSKNSEIVAQDDPAEEVERIISNGKNRRKKVRTKNRITNEE